MPSKKSRKNSKPNELEELKWELRKRGVRPTGTVQNMLKRLEDMEREEAEAKAAKKAAAAATVSKVNNRRNSNGKTPERQRPKATVRDERAKLVLWRRPLLTLAYFICEIPCSLRDAKDRFVTSLYDPKKRTVPVSSALCILLFFTTIIYGNYFYMFKNDPTSVRLKEEIAWFSYWIFLGILSSVGLGTGLHTFLLYLGPFIAKVTVAAQECQSIEFPRPPYPEEVICPEDGVVGTITIWDIMAKIRWESLMWGFGTALGELPPYFMARAARVSGMNSDDEDLEEFTELIQRKKKADPSTLSWLERGKLWMEDIVEKVGFWGILACASIPNPLFDLAGITCGHFLVPFSTFFTATVIGKAIVKTHLQMMFVILAFNEELLNHAVGLIGMIPKIGPLVSEPFIKLLDHQKHSLHHKDSGSNSEGGLLAYALEKLVMCMVIYFIISIVNAMAQSYHKRLQKDKKAKS